MCKYCKCGRYRSDATFLELKYFKQPARYNFVAPGATKSDTTFLEVKYSRRPA